jgi:uncharacterized protein YbjT (DUF2867 family)
MSPPKMLVTGATGNVGAETIHELVRRGFEVRAGVHSIDHATAIAGEGVEIFPFDWNLISSVRALLKGIENAFLITPVSQRQLEWTTTFVDCARASGLNHLVKLSILGAESNPGIALTRLHREAEEYIAASSIHYTFLQPNSFMQNFIHGSSPLSGMIYMPLGDARVSYIDAMDIGRVAAEILINGQPHFGQMYSLTGPMALSMHEVAAIFSDALRRHISYIPISEETAEHAMESQGMSQWIARAMLELHTEGRNGHREMVTRDVELLTNRKPRSFEVFSRSYAEQVKAPGQIVGAFD